MKTRTAHEDHDAVSGPCALCAQEIPTRNYSDTGERIRLCPGCLILIGSSLPIRVAIEAVRVSMRGLTAKRSFTGKVLA